MIDLINYIRTGQRHAYYNESVEAYNSVRVHAKGEYPRNLIEEARPGETEKIRNHRRKIYQAVTKSPMNKVISSLYKIRKSQDYAIQFGEVPPRIAEEETPQEYLSKDFPNYESLDNWFWSVGFDQMMLDGNSVALVMPLNIIKEETEYYKPYPIIFNSDQVWDYVYNEWYLLLSKEQHYITDKGRTQLGKVFYYVDKVSIKRFEQINLKEQYKVEEFIHELGYCPIVYFNGKACKDNAVNILYESRLMPMIPEMNEAAREYSDLQASVIQHMHPTMWAIQGKECKKCKGMGYIPTPNVNGGQTDCKACNGNGFAAFNPYEHISIRPAKAGEQNPPTPSVGYVTKPTDIVDIQDRRVQDHIYYALAAVNYEFIATVPLSQSGVAKEFDRAELNNFVYSVAEDCVRALDKLHKVCIDYRYLYVVGEEVDDLYPIIPVPEKFDIVPDNYLSDEIKKLKDSKVNPIIIAAAEVEYAGKKFYHNTEIKGTVLLSYKLDPLAGVNEDDIFMRLQNNGISKKDYVIHCNIIQFIEQASEAEGFKDLDITQQRQIIGVIADKFIKSNSASGAILKEVNGTTEETS